MGGHQKFVEKLDSVFTMPPVFDESAYGGVIHEIREMQQKDIEEICTTRTENKIFEMVDAVTEKKSERHWIFIMTFTASGAADEDSFSFVKAVPADGAGEENGRRKVRHK